jgi:hypothetical protein
VDCPRLNARTTRSKMQAGGATLETKLSQRGGSVVSNYFTSSFNFLVHRLLAGSTNGRDYIRSMPAGGTQGARVPYIGATPSIALLESRSPGVTAWTDFDLCSPHYKCNRK